MTEPDTSLHGFWDRPLRGLFELLQATPAGLTSDEATRRLRLYGPNSFVREARFAGWPLATVEGGAKHGRLGHPRRRRIPFPGAARTGLFRTHQRVPARTPPSFKAPRHQDHPLDCLKTLISKALPLALRRPHPFSGRLEGRDQGRIPLISLALG